MKAPKLARLAFTAGLTLSAAPAFASGTVVFRDDFDAGQLDANRWLVGNWKLGRTQLGNVPVLAGGMAQLRFDTYRFTGTEIITTTSYPLGNGVEFEARVRLNYLPSGLVAAMFTYKSQARLSDEIDIEILSKQVNASVGGAPLLLTTWNNWDESSPTYGDGIHHSSRSVFVNGLDVNAFHTYLIRWLPGRTEWLLDGVMLASSTQAQPDLATPFRLNFWAPAQGWTSAYDANLKPARNARQNLSYFVDVDWVEIRALP